MAPGPWLEVCIHNFDHMLVGFEVVAHTRTT